MANFSYKEVKTTTLKVAGILDVDRGTIEVDGVEKRLSTLLSDFNNECVEFTLKIKEENELDEPGVVSQRYDEQGEVTYYYRFKEGSHRKRRMFYLEIGTG